jgi:hypothetical protein
VNEGSADSVLCSRFDPPCSEEVAVLDIAANILVETGFEVGEKPIVAVLFVESYLRTFGLGCSPKDHVDGVAARTTLDVARVLEVGVHAESLSERNADTEFVAGDAVSGVSESFALIEPAARPEPLPCGRLLRAFREQDSLRTFDHEFDTGLGHSFDEQPV